MLKVYFVFFNNLYCRLELIELRKYVYTGEIQCVALSNLAMNLKYQIPIRYRVKPFVYCGIKYGHLFITSNLILFWIYLIMNSILVMA